MNRLVVLGVFFFLAAVFWASLRGVIHGISSQRSARAKPNPKGYEWERKPDQLYGRVKPVAVPGEDREGIVEFVQGRRGVEAYMEPRTLMYPLSVVLVAEDGEWARFQLRDDSFIRELSGTHGLRVYDAGKVGYPERMRRYRRGGQTDPESG